MSRSWKATTAKASSRRIVARCSLSSRQTATARVRDWLDRDRGTAASAPRLHAVCAEHPTLRRLIGIAEGSPHLWDLVRADPARLASFLHEAIPNTASTPFSPMQDATSRNARVDEAEVMRRLRRMKAEAALLIALCRYRGRLAGHARDRALRRSLPMRRSALAPAICSPMRGARQAQHSRNDGPARAAATSCSRWARWVRTSSTIRATSISSFSTIRPLRFRRMSSRRRFTCG